MNLSMPLVLASASPRRKELLSDIIADFKVCAADIEERRLDNESPADYVSRLALEKAQAVSGLYPEHWLLGSDTIVVSGNLVFEKPKDKDDFLRMFSVLSGATHQVMTAIAVVKQERHWVENVITDVTFRTLSMHEIDTYWDSGEPSDKAGGYGIQGQAGCFVERIVGSYSAVVGLPLCQTHQLLTQALQET
ncbi:Maf family protein [Echinimonas agarilytica]|uniref:dTTP/UTP pyrophosphatase n=1 Tax=Echinimonas agarilytica TaxID=1215918 RepID=A0AA41W4B1_9GAMM|nr:Maf family protein [Echinimonas agarilytica]MCM2678597.1 Maf family nucleotide pyrophosphatase [Echinimonas agarilytica]